MFRTPETKMNKTLTARFMVQKNRMNLHGQWKGFLAGSYAAPTTQEKSSRAFFLGHFTAELARMG